MSRGIGQLQREILAQLAKCDKPHLARVLAASIWRSSGREGRATRALEVSVRRALHGLASRGLINVSRVPDDKDAISYGIRGHDTLVAWLPGSQGPPWLCNAGEPALVQRENFLHNVPGKTYENRVLDILQRRGPEVEYSVLIDAMVMPFWPDVSQRYPALRRAVLRLQRDGVVSTTGRWKSRRLSNPHLHITTVRLVDS